MKMIPLFALLLFLPARCPAQETDPFAGDRRLLKKHTIKAAGIPLKELLEQLTKETGIQLGTTSRVAEDKVVLYAHDRPLVDSLTAISRFFNFYWGRNGNAGSYSYLLSQSLRQKQAEEGEIEAQYVRAADQTLRDFAMILELDRLDAEALKALPEGLRDRIRAEQDPVKREELAAKATAASMLSGNRTVGHIARALRPLGRERILGLLHGERVEFSHPPEAGKEALGPAIGESIIRTSGLIRPDRPNNYAAITARGVPGSHPQIHAW